MMKSEMAMETRMSRDQECQPAGSAGGRAVACRRVSVAFSCLGSCCVSITFGSLAGSVEW